jgi:hypothetical protein
LHLHEGLTADRRVGAAAGGHEQDLADVEDVSDVLESEFTDECAGEHCGCDGVFHRLRGLVQAFAD